MGIGTKFKQLIRRSKDDGASETSLVAHPNLQQQADASVNATFGSSAPNASSGESQPVPANDQANASQESQRDEPTEQLRIPNDSGGSIRQMWDEAYEDLQNKESSLVQEFEEQVCGNLSAGLGTLVRSHVGRKDWLETVLKHKMEQVNRDSWKLQFGSTEVFPVQDVVKPVLSVVKWANDFVAKAMSSNPYASIAWSGVSLLLPLLLAPFEQASALAKGLEHVSSLIVRSSMWEDLYVRNYESHKSGASSAPHTAYRSALKELYREVLKFQIFSYHHLCHNTISRLGLDAVKHDDWTGLLEQIKYRETEFEKVLTLWRDKMYTDEWEAAQERHQEVMSHWQSIGNDISDLKMQIERMRQDGDRSKLLGWLSTVDPSVQYNSARDRHRSGTCEWLVKENEEFEAWEKDPKSFAWLHGKAGSGKSVLSSSVIKHLNDKHEKDPKSALAYFFFSFGNLEQQKVTNMLSSLIRQLCTARPDTPQPIEGFKSYMDKGQRPDMRSLETALIATVRGFSAVYIVIDALDECPAIQDERRNLLGSLRRIIDRMPETLHIFCTSRDEQDIRSEIDKVLNLPAKTSIDLTNNRVGLDNDLSLYIDTVLDAREWPRDMKARAKSVLMERADGMFQYLVCQFEVLRHKNSEQDILETLDRLPRGLDETYNRLLLKLAHHPQILDSLKWLAFSRMPLHIDEFAEAFILRPEAANELGKKRLYNAKHALLDFPSIVTTEKRREQTFNKEWKKQWRDEIYVRLAHFTVKEYLMSDRIGKSSAKQFHLTEAGAHLHIAHCCLSYHLSSSAEDGNQDEDLPLRRYAAINWTWHLELAPRDSWLDDIVRLAKQALSIRSESLRTMIMEGPTESNDWFTFGARQQNMHRRPFCYTAVLGCLNLTKLLLSENSRASKYLTKEDLDLTLREAVQGGSLDIVRFLLHEGADVNGKSQVLNGALQIAAYRDNLEIMELLLNHGANIDEHDGKRGSALKAAALGGNLAALRLLVDHKADVRKAGCVLSCLMAAYKEKDVAKYTQILHLLLDKGADINRKCTQHGSPLNAAIKTWLCHGTRSFFDLAIQRGADITLDDGLHGSALQAACIKHSHSNAYRCPEVLEVLLDMRANLIEQGGEYDDALQTACYETHNPERTVHLLLDRGADINKRGGPYGSAFHAACMQPSPVLVDFLLERGANVGIQGGDYGSVLQAACSENCILGNNEKVARKLIESGADVHAPGGKFGSALQAAASLEGRWTTRGGTERRASLEELLLSEGAEVNRQGGIYGTALQSACVGGRVEAVRLLLSHGAEVNVKGGKYGTALQAACVAFPDRDKNHCDVAHELIKHGANVHVQGGLFGSAWHAAAATDDDNLLQLLLDHGADVNDCHGQHGTALQASLELYEFDSVIERIRFLIDRGADVNLEAGRYGFPLQSACLAALNNPSHLRIDLCANTHGLIYLLENCPDINVNMTGGLFGTALQAAVYQGKPKFIIELLLEKGACAKIRGGKYRSALNAAVFQGYWDLVETLLNAGAEPDCQLSPEPDEEWLKEVGKEEGQGAVDRYRKFWEVEKLKLGAGRMGPGQDNQRGWFILKYLPALRRA